MEHFIFTHILCGIVSYGITFAYFEKDYPNYRENMGFSIVIGMFGFIGLIVSFLLSGFAKNGLKFK